MGTEVDGFWVRGGGVQLRGEGVRWRPACGACVCLAGVKKKEPVNRDCRVSAPRFPAVRLASPPNPVHPLSPAPSFALPLEPSLPGVRTEFRSNAVRREGEGGLSLGRVRGVWRK